MSQFTRAHLECHISTITNILRARFDDTECRDYLFGVLFLKCCSDVYGEYARNGALLDKRRERIFVPLQARWTYIQQYMYGGEDVGVILNTALRVLQRANKALEGVLDHIDFQRKTGKYSPSQVLLRDVLAVLNKYSLRADDFAVPDLLGTVYEFLVSEFSDADGRRRGECYTPPGAASLLVRIIAPQARMSIYDPCVGSGRLLLLAQRSLEGQSLQGWLDLSGQDSSARAWATCKMNMILHGLTARIECDDTLAHPLLTNDGMLEKFDAVISNPPFSQNYRYSDLPLKERFCYGRCPDTGGKADLMFVQHMLSVTKRGGVVATVLPHGALFRSGSEKQIRRAIIEEDTLEAVIGLPANLFGGTAIPTCILVLRPEGGKLAERRGKVLFINADAEFGRERVQNVLRPADVEKIILTFEAFRTIPGYSSVVGLDELASHDWNLNIRLYADNTPPPESQDVQAHLTGGIPRQEVVDKFALFQTCGLSPLDVFVERDAQYLDFSPSLTERSVIRSHIGACSGVLLYEACLREAFSGWWQQQEPFLRTFPLAKGLADLRTHFISTFLHALSPQEALGDWQFAGIIAEWWEASLCEFNLLAASGPIGLVDSWIDVICSGEADQRIQRLQDMNERHLKIMRQLLPDYTQDLFELEVALQELYLQQESLDEEHTYKFLDLDDGNEELKEGSERIKSYPHHRKAQINAVRGRLQALRTEFPTHLEKCREMLTLEKCVWMISSILRDELAARLDQNIELQRQQVVIAVELWWDKYFVTLRDLVAKRDAAEAQMGQMLERLGYYK